MNKTLFTALLLITSCTPASIDAVSSTPQSATRIAQADLTDGTLTPQEVQQTAKNISVRVTTSNNGGSGVIIAQKGNNYLILTNAHVVRRATKIEIQAPDGQKYQATSIDGGFDSKYDLALLQFTSKTKYTLANLSSISGSPLTPERTIYSAGFPFDSKEIRITSGQVSQLSDIPFDDGTQIGYVTDKGKQGIRQGMSGGAIFDAQGNLLGINTVGVAPILPDYTYNDGSKPIAKLKAQYTRANWGIPVYNFLTNVKADILYGYANLPKVERQVTPTGYMAKLNIKARQMTVRIENSGGNGSGVIVAREGNSYYVLTAKHVVQNRETNQKYTNNQIITYDQDRQGVTSSVVAEGVDLAVIKFESNNNYLVAQLGEYNLNESDFVFVGGFPGREKINSPLWQWQLNPGYIYDRESGKLSTQDKTSFSEGYDLIYTSISYGGMSGGPVFDNRGNVIGIHGKAEGDDTGNIILGHSLGVSIQTFLGLASKLQIPSQSLGITRINQFALNAIELSSVMATMQNIPKPQIMDDGKHWLTYGNQLRRIYQYDKSVAAFDFAINKNQRLLGNYGKAVSLMGARKYRLAENTIAQAIASIPPNKQVKYYFLWKGQSLILSSLKKYEKALSAIDIAIRLEPNDLTLLNQKGIIYKEKKDYANAIIIYNEIIRRQPQSYAYLNRGTNKFNSGNKQDAIIDFDRAIDLNPRFKIAYYNRGTAKSALGNKQEAINDYDRVITIDPTDSEAYYNRGNAKSALGNSQEAIIDYNRAIALDPKYVNAYNNRGLAKSALGNKQEAIIDYSLAIALDPKLAQVYNNRGLAKSDLGNEQEAIIDYNRAIAIDSKYANAYYNRGNAKSVLGKKQEAIIDFNSAIALNNKFTDAYFYRGLAKTILKSNREAIIDYSQVIALDPNYDKAYYHRGAAKADLGYKQEAINDFNQAISFNPKDDNSYFNRGVNKLALGQKKEAVADLNQAISLNPKVASFYYVRSVAQYTLGQKPEAITDMSKAAKLFQQEGKKDSYQEAMKLLNKFQSN